MSLTDASAKFHLSIPFWWIFEKWKCELLRHVWFFVTLWTVACQAPLSLGFSTQEYWSGFPCPCSGDLPNPGIKPGSPTLQTESLPSEPPGKPLMDLYVASNAILCSHEPAWEFWHSYPQTKCMGLGVYNFLKYCQMYPKIIDQFIFLPLVLEFPFPTPMSTTILGILHFSHSCSPNWYKAVFLCYFHLFSLLMTLMLNVYFQISTR